MTFKTISPYVFRPTKDGAGWERRATGSDRWEKLHVTKPTKPTDREEWTWK